MDFLFLYENSELEFYIDDACKMLGKSSLTVSDPETDLSSTYFFSKPISGKHLSYEKQDRLASLIIYLRKNNWKCKSLNNLIWKVIIEDPEQYSEIDYSIKYLKEMGLYMKKINEDIIFTLEKATPAQYAKAIKKRNSFSDEEDTSFIQI